MSECVDERVAIIAEGCKVSHAEAQAIYDRTQYVAPEHYSEKVRRLRELATLQRMGKRKHDVDRKLKASGE